MLLMFLPGSKSKIKEYLHYRLKAAKGDGYMPGADHSIPSNNLEISLAK